MAVSERSRHAMYQKLEEVLGAGPAGTMMEMLHPADLAHLATKEDLAALEARMITKIDLSRHEAATKVDLEKLRAEMHKVARSQLLAFTTIVAVLNGAVVAGLKLL